MSLDFSTITPYLGGFSVGYNYCQMKNAEDAVAKGKNYTVASFQTSAQVGFMCEVANQITGFFPLHPVNIAAKVALNILPLFSIPLCVLSASVREGNYENIKNFCNTSTVGKFIKLPEKLSARQIKIANFVVDNLGNYIQAAIAASAIAIIILGNAPYGLCFFGAVGYNYIDRKGYVPRQIRVVVEKCMPTITLVGMILTGTILTRIISSFVLLSHSSSMMPKGYSHIPLKIVDSIFRSLIISWGPSIAELEAPVKKRENMDYSEVMDILNDKVKLKVNPAHCVEPIVNEDLLPKDHNFNNLLTIFNSIDWKSKHQLILGKLANDNRFVDMLIQKYGVVEETALTRNEVRKNFKTYLSWLVKQETHSTSKSATASSSSKVADDEHPTEDAIKDYIIKWTREQLVEFVKVLTLKKRTTGSELELNQTIKDCSIFLPFLEGLKDPKDKEDYILRIAVEAGNYCGTGQKRGLIDLKTDMFTALNMKGYDKETPPPFETRLRQKLSEFRKNQIDRYFYWVTRIFENHKHMQPGSAKTVTAALDKAYDAFKDDVHTHDGISSFTSYGFYPQSQNDKENFSLWHYFMWKFQMLNLEMFFYYPYQFTLSDALDDKEVIIQDDFRDHVRNVMIPGIKGATDVQKSDLENLFFDIAEEFGTVNPWPQDTRTQTLERFKRLYLVQQGILIPDNDRTGLMHWCFSHYSSWKEGVKFEPANNQIAKIEDIHSARHNVGSLIKGLFGFERDFIVREFAPSEYIAREEEPKPQVTRILEEVKSGFWHNWNGIKLKVKKFANEKMLEIRSLDLEKVSEFADQRIIAISFELQKFRAFARKKMVQIKDQASRVFCCRKAKHRYDYYEQFPWLE